MSNFRCPWTLSLEAVPPAAAGGRRSVGRRRGGHHRDRCRPLVRKGRRAGNSVPHPSAASALRTSPDTRSSAAEFTLRVEEKKFHNLVIGPYDYGVTHQTVGARGAVAREMSERVTVPIGSSTNFTSLGARRRLMLSRDDARVAAASPADGRVSGRNLVSRSSRCRSRGSVTRALGYGQNVRQIV